jgi:hypothetical protein
MNARPCRNGRSSARIVDGSGPGRASVVLSLASVVLGLTLVACASTPPPASTTAGSLLGSPPAGGPSGSPVGTFWPERVPPAIVALGAGDNEIRKAGVDMAAAVDAQDLRRMRGVADGLANLTAALLPHAQAVSGYAPFGDLGRRAVTALTHLHDGAVALRDAITAGNAEEILAASTAIGGALEEYGAIRPALSDLVPEALRQQRALLK